MPYLKPIPIRDHSFYREELSGFKAFMEVPRDGNCLYSSFALAIFGHLREGYLVEFLDKAALFDKTGVCDVVYQSYIEDIGAIVNHGSVEEGGLLHFVGYLKLVVASHILENRVYFSQFLNSDVEDYVKMNVSPMGERGGEVEIVALQREFNCKITIISIKDQVEYTSYGDGRVINILHTPDHFEPVFK